MMSDRHGGETLRYGSAEQQGLIDVAQFRFLKEMMSDKDKAAPLICVETQKPGRDASPDVHGLDAVRQLI